MIRLIVLALLFFPLFAHAEDKPCELNLKPIRLGIRHTEGEGIGYNKGYSSLDFTAIPFSVGSLLFLTDLRGHRLTNGKFAGNGGLGVRYPHLNSGYAYGINGFYDYRRQRQTNLNRLGVGLEAPRQLCQLPRQRLLSHRHPRYEENILGQNLPLPSRSRWRG